MPRLKISLEAARIIALTAVIGFVDGSFRIEDAISFRNGTALVTTRERITSILAAKDSKPEMKAGSAAYLIEISRGDSIKKVLVDSVTGRVLLS